jgi:hypothetical protein
MNDIEHTLAGTGIPHSLDLEKIIGPPPPPPDGSVPFSPKDAFTHKEAKAAERALDRSADAFAAGRVNKTLLRKFGQIAQTIPGAERIRLRKRRENGNLGYIGEYNFRDLASVGDMEVFIAKYAKPQFGAGEYDVTIIDQSGREFPGGSVWIEGAPEAAPGMNGGMVDLVRDLVARNATPQPVQDPIETMRRAQALAKELKESAGNDPMVAMMAMQQLAPRQTGPDPMMLAALERLAARVEAISAAPPLTPPLPPAPAEKSIDWISLGSTVVLPLLQMFQQNQQAQQQMQMQMQQQNMATMLSLMSNKDSLSTKDLLALMNEQHSRSLELLQRKVDEERPQNTIEDQMQALVKMKEFAAAFAPPAQAAPQGASFWDALVALASSQDMAGALADRIRQRDAARALPPPQRATIEHQTPHPTPPPAMPAPQERVIPLPPALKDGAAKIAMAGDSATRVQATIEALVSLQSDPHFNRFVMALLEATAKNEQKHALRGLGGWLKMLIENKLLTREIAMMVLQDFEEHWDLIRSMLIERIPLLRQFAEAPTAQAAPAQAAPPAQAEPAPAVDPSIPQDVEIPAGYEAVPA